MSGKPELIVADKPADAFDPGAIDYIDIALRNKKLLILGGIAGLVLGVLYYLKAGPTYTATAQILVSRRKAPMPTDRAESVTVYSERSEHIALIMSPMIVEKAVRKHGLDKLPSLSWADDPVTEIVDEIDVERSAGGERSLLNVLNIKFTCASPKDAETVVNAIADAYHDYLLEDHRENTREVVKLISTANQSLRGKLDDAHKAYVDWKKSTPHQWRGASGPGGQPGQLTNMHQELVVAIGKERQAVMMDVTRTESKKDMVITARDSNMPREQLEAMIQQFILLDQKDNKGAPAASGGQTSDADSHVIPLLLKYKTLLRRFGHGHPAVLDVVKSLQELKQYYRRMGKNIPQLESFQDSSAPEIEELDFAELYLKTLDTRLEELAHRDTLLQQELEEQSVSARDLAALNMEEEKLRGDISNIKMLWGRAVKSLEELSLVENTSGYSMKMMSPPKSEINIKRPIKFAGAFMILGGIAAMALALLRELRDTAVKSADDLRNRLGLSVLGGVPMFRHADRRQLNESRHSHLHASLNYLHSPGSIEAEAIRTVRTALVVQSESQQARVIQMTSPEPFDGKTTILANVAIALAQSGRRVLLVDADLRRPIMHTLFNSSPDIGLSDVLSGDVELPNAVQQTEIAGLSIVTAGAQVASPAELLSSPHLQSAIATAASEYDLVLIDSPPLLAVSDPCVVGQFVDAALMVIQIGKTPLQHAARAAELLESHGVRLLGTIANGIFDMAERNQNTGEGYGFETYGGNVPAAPAVSDHKAPVLQTT